MTTRIRFHGAADTVTGSRYLVETDSARLLVDCGLFQGYRKLRERNWSQLPFDPASLDAVVLTHGHVEHAGYLPRLCKLGFKGSVHCTRGTRDLLGILLPDLAQLQEEDARRANKYGYTRHHPAEPLYTHDDAERCLEKLSAHSYDECFEPVAGFTAAFTRAGHIIGSACLALRTAGGTVTFSGDVGRLRDPIMKPPAPLGATDYLVIESTYGDRRHQTEHAVETLARVLREAVDKRGVVLVPAFAVGRAQHFLHLVAQLKADRRIPELPIFLDSPMANDFSGLFREHGEDHRLGEEACRAMGTAAKFARTREESKAIHGRDGPMVILSPNGMATGGRILHHLRRFLPDHRNAVLLLSYQASGTCGSALGEGASDLKIHGEHVRVGARVVQVDGLSSHADYVELIDWLEHARLAPRQGFVTHGEPAASDGFRRRLRDAFGWRTVVPDDGSEWTLT